MMDIIRGCSANAASIPPALFVSPLGTAPTNPAPSVFTNFNSHIGQLRITVPMRPGMTAWTICYWARMEWKPPSGISDNPVARYGVASPQTFYTFGPCRPNLTTFLSESGMGPKVFPAVLPATRPPNRPDGSDLNVFSNGVFAVALDVDGIASLTVAADTVSVTNTLVRNFQGRPLLRDIAVNCDPSVTWTLRAAIRPVEQFFVQNTRSIVFEDNNIVLSPDWIITNEYVFCAHRVRLEGTNHFHTSHLIHASQDALPEGIFDAFHYPDNVDVTADTICEVRTIGSQFPHASNTVWNVWNATLRDGWISDDSIMAIRDGDLRAMQRLGIKIWHTQEQENFE
jgi:hypothetical protein